MAKYCEYCDGLLEEGVNFCPSCGARVTTQVKDETTPAASAATDTATQTQTAESAPVEETVVQEDEENLVEDILSGLGKAATTLAGGSLLGGILGRRKRKAPQRKPPEHSRFTVNHPTQPVRNAIRHDMPMQPPRREAPGGRNGIRPAGPGRNGGGPGDPGGRRGGHGGPGGPGRR